MKFNPEIHRRRSIRLPGYDYKQAGWCFVTVCTRTRECLFGEEVRGSIYLSALGKVAEECWRAVPHHFPNVTLDSFVIMPNHVHGIIVIVDSVGARHASPLRKTNVSRLPSGPGRSSLGAVVGSFKSATSRHINRLRGRLRLPIWQRNYYEHVIRNEKSLNTIRQYIQKNPSMWPHDIDNPNMPLSNLKAIAGLLAQQYGFTHEEVDFILNYDIKHRMGQYDRQGA